MVTQTRRPMVAGNWKMNGLAASLSEIEALGKAIGTPGCDVMVCPPATLIAQVAWQIGRGGAPIVIGGQDCHAKASGAHTGDIAAEMLADAGAKAAIVGHSERRQDHGEGDEAVRAKAVAAHRAGLVAIICVGETLAERDAGNAAEVVERQLQGSLPEGCTGENTVIAYEPVWAIGTGRTPVAADIEAMHGAIRARLAGLAGEAAGAIRILYGGSVKPDNAGEILRLNDVDGALVGGASLKAVDFAAIIAIYA